MVFIYQETCSKCGELSRQLADRGFSWTTIRHLAGELTEDLVRFILERYDGPRSNLIRDHEPEWQAGGLNPETASITDLTAFILAHPVVLQRPIVVVGEHVVVARPPEVLWQVLTETR